MTVVKTEYVKGLDIWGIVNKELGQFEEISVIEADLSLDLTKDEFELAILYYEDTVPIQERTEYPKTQEIKISAEEASRIYAEISNMVELPLYVDKLSVSLNGFDVPVFSLEIRPTMRI